MIKNATLPAAAGEFARNSTPGGASLEWNPQSLGTSVTLAVWTPYADNSTVTESSGAITQIDDLSGNGNHLTVSGNSPNWNSGTDEVEFDDTNSEGLVVTGMLPVDTNDEAVLVYVFTPIGSDLHDQWFTRAASSRTNATDIGWAWSAGGTTIRVWNANTIEAQSGALSGAQICATRVDDTNGVQLRIGGVVADSTVSTGLRAKLDDLYIATDGGVDHVEMNFRGAVLVRGAVTDDVMERLEAWLAFKCGVMSEIDAGHTYKDYTFTDPPAASYDPTAFFDTGADFGDKTGMTTDVDGETWFVSVPTEVSANQGSGNGDEFFSNDTTQHGSDIGWESVTNGIQVRNDEISLKVRMYNGTTEDGLNTDAGEDYCQVHIIEWQGGSNNDTRKKWQGLSDKIQGNGTWKHAGPFDTNIGGGGTDEDDVAMDLGVSPNNGDIVFLGKMRDVDNQRFYQWVGIIAQGNTSGANLNENDTITQSTNDGQVYYLDTIEGLKGDGGDEMELYFNEETVLRQTWYKKMASTGQFSTVDTEMKNFYDHLVSTYFP